MDFVDLVDFVIAWEEGKEGDDFKKDAAYAPEVHFVAVIAIG